MNPLERHGIDHLSASSLNLWMANPREWAVRYLAKEAEEEYKREEAEAVPIAERLKWGITPMGPEDYGADADRQACSCADCECD